MASPFFHPQSLKRSEDPDTPRVKKRAKYTQVACNECKRRKLKCSGEAVCSRCASDNVPCIYTPNAHSAALSREADGKEDGLSNRFQAVDQQIEALQREMRAMSARMQEMEATTRTPHGAVSTPSHSSGAAALHRIMNPPKSPSFVGPTSAEFGLVSQQKPSEDSDGGDFNDPSDPSTSASESALAIGDPLRSLGHAEALRLLKVYENIVDIMYPCVDLESVRKFIDDFYQLGYPASPSSNDQEWFLARDAEVLKVILATALIAESHGHSERAAQLADSVEDKFATRMKVAEVDMKELLILTLLSIFHSYRDDEVISWRLIGIASRGAMEMGLHCQDTWLKTGGVFPGELQCMWAIRLFWCIYVLDRRWSFGTGLPFAMQDSDMDTNLPEPGASTPYITCMISYARLSTKIWNLVMGWRTRPHAATSDYCSYLDFQVQQWAQSIPHELRFDPASHSSPRPDKDDNITMLQVLLALQVNQLRTMVYRQNLMSSDSIEADTPGASTAVETAKNTVHMLKFFSQVSDMYFQRPEPFNYFLISALAALFLAVLHAPSRFSQVCRPEFYTAVDLVRRSSTRARTSRRLQKIIRSLNSIKLNLGSNKSGPSSRPPTRPPAPTTPSNHAIANMSTKSVNPPRISEPYHHATTSQSTGILTPQPSTSLWPVSPATVQGAENSTCDDLTSFFEMAGGLYFDPALNPANEGMWHENGQAPVGLDAFQAEDEALTRVMAGLL